jgi:hypothetical protein
VVCGAETCLCHICEDGAVLITAEGRLVPHAAVISGDIMDICVY